MIARLAKAGWLVSHLHKGWLTGWLVRRWSVEAFARTLIFIRVPPADKLPSRVPAVSWLLAALLSMAVESLY